MNLELNIYDLGNALKKLGEEYKLEALIKMNLSGGWMTLMGEATIENIPVAVVNGCSSKSNNIIDIKIKNEEAEEGTVLKITGAKDKKFNVNIAPGKYIELSSNTININQVKTNDKECKIRIDEDIIFIVKTTVENVKKLMNV